MDGRRDARISRYEADGPVRFGVCEEVDVRAAGGRDDPRAVAGDVDRFARSRGVVVARIVLRDCQGVVEDLREQEGGDALEGEGE